MAETHREMVEPRGEMAEPRGEMAEPCGEMTEPHREMVEAHGEIVESRRAGGEEGWEMMEGDWKMAEGDGEMVEEGREMVEDGWAALVGDREIREEGRSREAGGGAGSAEGWEIVEGDWEIVEDGWVEIGESWTVRGDKWTFLGGGGARRRVVQAARPGVGEGSEAGPATDAPSRTAAASPEQRTESDRWAEVAEGAIREGDRPLPRARWIIGCEGWPARRRMRAGLADRRAGVRGGWCGAWGSRRGATPWCLFRLFECYGQLH